MSQSRAARLLFFAVIVFALATIGRNLYRRHLNTALIAAVEAGDTSEARLLLAKGADPNVGKPPTTESSESTPLLSLVLRLNSNMTGQEEDIACLLIQHGARISGDKNETNYLSFACDAGSTSVVHCLLEKGVDPNVRNSWLETPVDRAVRYGFSGDEKPSQVETSADRKRKRVSHELTRLLQAYGAHFTLRDAVMMNDLTTTRAMLDAGANIDARETTQTLNSLSYDNTPQQDGVVKPYAIPSAQHAQDDNTPLQEGVARGYLEESRLLLERGAAINARSKGNPPPLITALLHKRADLVRLLLARGADVNLSGVDDDTDDPASFSENNLPALALAIVYMPEFVPELLQKGADVNAKYGAALKAAIGQHNLPLIRELLKRGANVNPSLPIRKVFTTSPSAGARKPMSMMLAVASISSTMNSRPVTTATKSRITAFSPLMLAVCNAPECEALLLRAGAKIGPDKSSILPAVVLSGHSELMPHLLTLGADVNGTDRHGETALSLAVVHAPADVKFLLEHGAKPNIVTRSMPSRTLLSQAAMSGEIECVRLLLAHHAEVNLRLAQGHTPLYYARKHNHADVATLLQQAGGKEE